MSYSDPIAIVATSCIFPGAHNPKELWENCLSEKNMFSTLSQDRWNINHHYSSDRTLNDKTYSKIASEIKEDHFRHLISSLNLPTDCTRLEAYLMYALSELNLKKFHQIDSKKKGFILGLMNPDEEYNHGLAQNHNESIFKKLLLRASHPAQQFSIDKVFQVVQKLSHPEFVKKDRFLSTIILEKVCNQLNIDGVSFLVDAACASSLSSVDIGISLLRSRALDLVVVGGAESNLSPGMYAVFSKVGALAQNHSLPFDKKTEGLVQGEGVGLFIIKRLADAIEQGDSIQAVIVGCDGSSDGKTSSLFQPNYEGQKMAYGRVHPFLKNNKLVYVEAHGTGTQTGDRTELKALSDYFQNCSFPVGSIKAQIGHTKGAAGAAGLIKAISILKSGIVPPSSHVEQPIESVNNVYFNPQQLHFQCAADEIPTVGVSAFGFGGTNYHLAIQPYLGQQTVAQQERPNSEKIFVLNEHFIPYDSFDAQWFLSPSSPYRIPPHSIDKIDKVQLLAVQAAWIAMNRSRLHIDFIPKQDVVVISSSILGLDICSDLAGRLQISALQAKISETPEDVSSKEVDIVWPLLEAIKSEYTPCGEDHAPGLLNNVIAGRVCHAFDFKGRSYNIERGFASADYALMMAKNELSLKRCKFVFVIYAAEVAEETETDLLVRRNGVGCKILATEEVCMDFMLTPVSELEIHGL